MREDDVVAARLRSVLAATTDAVRDQPPRRILYGGPVASSRYAAGLAELAEVGEPLDWSDVISSWPDDVDLDPLPDSASTDAKPDPAPTTPEASPTSGYPPGTPWASPPGSIEKTKNTEKSEKSPTPPKEDPMHEAEHPHAPVRPAGPDHRPLPPPAWVLPEEPEDTTPWPDHLAWQDTSVEPDSPLSGAGAFGGAPPEDGRRFGLGAFDPGRRGVKALAAVAAVVLLIAAYLAWHSRPQVDTVAPPAFATTDATTDAPARGTSPSATELVVAVGGKVRKPGLVRLPSGARVADALDAAGGPDPGVDVAMLNLARKVVDGELIMVGVTPAPGVAPPTGPAAGGTAAPGGLINLNTATLADLDTLPGVGPVLAQRILDARDAQGGFKAVSDLRKVDGIGDARYEQLKDLVTV